jgi:RHS repeat-associated protein
VSGAGAINAFYVRIGDELLEVIRPAASGWATRLVHHDGIGSVRALTDEAGVVSDTWAYEAFGTENVRVGNDGLAYGFAAEAFDSASKLAYHRARWMDARVGRFLGVDPNRGDERSPVSMHRYLYASNSPGVRIDPTGRFDMVSTGAVGSIVGIMASIAGCSMGAPGLSKRGKCEISSFSMEFLPLSTSRLPLWDSMRLPVKFTAQLGPGSSASGCRIGQDMMGMSSGGGYGTDIYRDWTPDYDVPNSWWDGDRWNGGRGSWSGDPPKAEFEDAPGFRRITEYPAYWGSLEPGTIMSPGHGPFRFRTWIKGTRESWTLYWGMHLELTGPGEGIVAYEGPKLEVKR